MINDPLLINDWHPVATTSQFNSQPIISVRLLGEDIVLWKSANQYMAWQDLCIHRGAKLSGGKIVGEHLQCPYHGWTYNHDGLCVKIPAHPEQTPPTKAKVKAYLAKEKYDMLWVCLGKPANDIPPFPEWEQNGYTWAVCDPIKNVPAHGPRIIENFLDAAHFPFVHEGVLGDQNHPEMEDFNVSIGANGIESEPVYIYQPAQYGTQGGGKVSYVYRAFRPFTAHMTKHVPAGWWGADAPSATHGLMLTLTPHDELDTTVWFLISSTMWTDPEVLQREYTKRITDIFEEDRVIVLSQRPELLPLDLQAELHLKSDRVAIAYRTWLKQLGLKFGTA